MTSTKCLGTAALALSVLAGCMAPPSPKAEERDIIRDHFPEAQVEIRQALIALSEDARVHNTEAQRLAHLNSRKFTAFGPDKPGVKGFAEQVEGELAFYSSLEGLTTEWGDLKIDVFGDVAVATSLLSFSATDADGERVEVDGARVTLVLIRTSDGWKIVHEHAS